MGQQQSQIQWFPGHMAKTRRLIKESLPLVDIVAQLLDARIPQSSQNPELKSLIGSKPNIILLNKCDIADTVMTNKWVEYFALKGITAIPVDCKSSKGLNKIINKSKNPTGAFKDITGYENIDKIIDIDQSPIGRTPRSNPATYTGTFDIIRELFSQTPEAKMRGYKPGRFSFNVKGGRCEACRGDGVKKIEMHFLPDVYVPCEICHGTRYNSETLSIKYKDKSIADVLNMRVSEALKFFENIPKIKNIFPNIIAGYNGMKKEINFIDE